jgi:hypothetical protein
MSYPTNFVDVSFFLPLHTVLTCENIWFVLVQGLNEMSPFASSGLCVTDA